MGISQGCDLDAPIAIGRFFSLLKMAVFKEKLLNCDTSFFLCVARCGAYQKLSNVKIHGSLKKTKEEAEFSFPARQAA